MLRRIFNSLFSKTVKQPNSITNNDTGLGSVVGTGMAAVGTIHLLNTINQQQSNNQDIKKSEEKNNSDSSASS